MGGITMKFKNKRKIIFIMGIFILMASIILSVFVLMPPETNNKKQKLKIRQYKILQFKMLNRQKHQAPMATL